MQHFLRTMRKPGWVIVGIWLLALVGIGVLVVVAVCFRVTAPAPVAVFTPPPEMEQFVNHLQVLWQRYLEMVQLLITLLTGVIAVSAGMVKFGQRDVVADREYFGAGIGSLLIGLTCAVLWRIDAELLMEIEIFGKPDDVRQLFSNHGVSSPFTSSFEYSRSLSIFSDSAYVLMVLTAAGLITGLALLSLFAYSNLPELTRGRSHHHHVP